jgi:hypothetical protein
LNFITIIFRNVHIVKNMYLLNASRHSSAQSDIALSNKVVHIFKNAVPFLEMHTIQGWPLCPMQPGMKRKLVAITKQSSSCKMPSCASTFRPRNKKFCCFQCNDTGTSLWSLHSIVGTGSKLPVWISSTFSPDTDRSCNIAFPECYGQHQLSVCYNWPQLCPLTAATSSCFNHLGGQWTLISLIEDAQHQNILSSSISLSLRNVSYRSKWWPACPQYWTENWYFLHQVYYIPRTF